VAGPFAGLKVVDATQSRAGGLATMLLADFGAEVLRIVSPARSLEEHPGATAWNRSKQALALDIDAAPHRARLEGLIAGADVVVLDQGPTRLTALDLEADVLVRRHPGLLALWLPPFGPRGPWRDLEAHHGLLMGLSGAAFRQGAWREGPVWHVTPLVHYAQATLGAAAAGAALLARARTGLGQAVTVSGLQALSQVACPLTPLGGEGFGRGAPIGDSPSYRLYPCADGEWLFLGALFSHFFVRAVEALEIDPGAFHDLGEAIGARLKSRPRDHWLALFRQHDVPAGPVARREDWLSSETAKANDLAATLIHPDLGRVRMPGVVARLSATPGSIRHPLAPATPRTLDAFAAGRVRPVGIVVTPKAAPLAGIKVLDLGTVIAGAYAGAILANLGADVVKIEPPQGDPFRFAMTGFVNYNRGKRGLGLDLKAPLGREVFLDLARTADVVLDNYRLGVRERLGIGYETLRAVNRRVISCSCNTFGARGPDATRPGFDPLIQAQSGLMAAQGGEGAEPVFHTIPVNDVAAAALTAFAIIAALNAREATGEGQEVETSLAGAASLYQFGELTDFTGRPPNPSGGRDCRGVSALERFYACKDGWLTLAATRPSQGAALAEILKLGPLEAETAILEPRDGPLAGAIAVALARWSRDEAVAALLAAGVPAAPTLDSGEAMACETLWENGYYQIQDHPQWGELVGARGFASFDGADRAFTRLEPQLGEHGLEILTDYGVPRERILEAAKAGVIFRGR
jgi:crotonobetainyl-CoA:carnitine CoA-transferase CaiB-like acyl-CoA transferase